MEIRHKITLQFTIAIAFLLLAILVFNYYQASLFAQDSFFERLKERSVSVAGMHINQDNQQKIHFDEIDKLNKQSLSREAIYVFDKSGKERFSQGSALWKPSAKMISEAIIQEADFRFAADRFIIGTHYSADNERYFIMASAVDEVGQSKLRNLAETMLVSFLVFLIFVVMLGQFLSGKALEPIKSVILQVNQITASNLDKRVMHSNDKDEIAQLSNTFNSMLERLEESFKMQADFVRNASHELRNPLAAMIGQAEIALKKDRNPEYYHEVIQAVYTESLRLKHIVNSLMQLSQASSDVVGQPLMKIRLDELLLDVVENLSRTDKNRHIEIRLDSDQKSEPIVLGSSGLLEVALGNLLENACKYSGNAPVSCVLSTENGRSKLVITDKGIGMTEEEIKHISEPFYRSPNVRNKEGFGIGMAVSSKVFQVHGISMKVKSKPGEGTNITLVFPEGISPRLSETEG